MPAFAQQKVRNQSSHLARPARPSRTALRPAHAVNPILAQQQAFGNQAMQRMLQSRDVQAKLIINDPGDRYEREADRVAEQVMRMPVPPLQRQIEPEEEEEEEEIVQTKAISDQITPLVQREVEPEKDEEEIQTKAISGRTSGVTPNIESHIHSLKSGGRPLPESARNYFEPRFGRDFGHVRIHSDEKSANSAQSVNALAYTAGRSIVFGKGQYHPNSVAGRRLIAHELTHVAQQRPGAVPVTSSVSRPVNHRSEHSRPLGLTAVDNVTSHGQKVIARLDDAGATPSEPELGETAAETSSVPAEVVSLDGATTFDPPATVASYLDAQEGETGDVTVRLGNLAEGTINVRKRDDQYETYPRNRPQTIPLRHPAIEPLRTRIGIDPVLALSIREGNISGYASVATERGAAPNPSALINSVRDNFEVMGWIGLEPVSFPRTKNELEAGILKLKVEGFNFSLGGFLNGTGNFGLENEAVTFDANATVQVQGLTNAELDISRDAEGNLDGQVEVPVEFANFSGNVLAKFSNGTVDIRGTAGYTTEKFEGEITLLVTDAATARNVALQRLGPEAVEASAEGAEGAETGRPRPGARALAGWGVLDFHFTEWMTGQAQVITDNEGHITVVGRITPPAEVEIFPQRDYIRRIFVVEVRTLYGVPLVGNVFLFANIGMDAMAKLGPGKIYQIEVLGTYSTDPRVFQNFSIAATLNISAFAGLRLRGEGGAGVELLDHDIKAGVGLNALAGVRGYVEATPTIGYRETADPEVGKQGEFYIRGHMELAAQPFLGLGGDLFVELDSPFWSPAPDKKWTWPVGELEYPLPGEFGIGADVDYVIGSGDLPEVQFGEVDFNADRFMTDLMSDHVPRSSQGEQEETGEWREGEVTGGSAEPQQVDTEGAPSAEPVRGRQGPEEGEAPRPENQERWLRGMRALGKLSERSQTDPFDQQEIDAALARLKARYGFRELRERRAGDRWRVHAEMNPTSRAEIKADEVSAAQQGGATGTPSAPESPLSTTERPPPTAAGPAPAPRAREDVRTIPTVVRTTSGVDVAIEADRLEHVLRGHTIENFDPVARAAEIVAEDAAHRTTFFRRGTVTNPRELYTFIKQALQGSAGRKIVAGANNHIKLTIRNHRCRVWVGPASGGGMRLNSIYPLASTGRNLTADQIRAYAAEINASTQTLDKIRVEIARLF